MKNVLKFLSNNFIIKKINKEIKNFKIKIKTRFSPEASGQLHIGHAKNIFTNINISKVYNGKMNLRIDDTNPKNNKKFFVKNIKFDFKWLIRKSENFIEKKILYTSNYFYKLIQYTEILIKKKLILWKNKKIVIKNLKLFRNIRNGKYKEKKNVIRIKNINLIIYRILYIKHYRCKNNWFIYPMYDYAHTISDKIENISYSICSLEFAKNQKLYQIINNFIYKNIIPKQIEFSKLIILNNITSKRKIKYIIKKNYIKSYKDPRLYNLKTLKIKNIKQNKINLLCKNLSLSKNSKNINLKKFKKNILYNNSKFKKKIYSINNLKLVIKLKNIKKNYFTTLKRKFFISKYLITSKINFINKIIDNKNQIKNFNKNIKLNNIINIRCENFKKNKYGLIKVIKCKKTKNLFKKNININCINKNYKNKINVIIYRDLIFKKNKNIFKKNINIKSKKILKILTQNLNIKQLNSKKYQLENFGHFIKPKSKNKPKFKCII